MANKDLTVRISEFLAEESGKDQEVLLYSLTLVKSALMGYGLLFLVSYIFGVWQYTLIAAVTASIFRVISGGAHASSPMRCSIIGILLFTSFGWMAEMVGDINRLVVVSLVLILASVSFLIFYRYAPADTPSKPINSHAQRKYLRVISFSLLVLWTSTALYSTYSFSGYPYVNYLLAGMLGLAWQVFTLTPLGYTTSHALDTHLKSIMERRGET